MESTRSARLLSLRIMGDHLVGGVVRQGCVTENNRPRGVFNGTLRNCQVPKCRRVHKNKHTRRRYQVVVWSAGGACAKKLTVRLDGPRPGPAAVVLPGMRRHRATATGGSVLRAGIHTGYWPRVFDARCRSGLGGQEPQWGCCPSSSVPSPCRKMVHLYSARLGARYALAHWR